MSPVGAKRGAKPHYHGGRLVSSSTVGVTSNGDEFDQVHVQNVGKHHVYVFGNEEDVFETDQPAIELTELRTRKNNRSDFGGGSGDQNHRKTTNFTKDKYVEKRVTDGETLSSVALQYGCTVAELKQANNIYNNQDFFAFKTVKIPVHKFSSLLEECGTGRGEKSKKGKAIVKKGRRDQLVKNGLKIENMEALNGDEVEIYSRGSESLSSFDGSDSLPDSPDSYEDGSNLTRTISIGKSLNGSDEGIEDFLNHMDKDIMKICTNVQTKKENLDDVISTLTVKCVHPLSSSEKVVEEQTYGSIFGFNWKRILTCVCVVPTLYLIIFLVMHFYKKKV